MKPDEVSLIEACLKHDQKACKQLYDSYAPQMLGVCMRYANNREDAQDILHEGFIKVFENLHKLRNKYLLGSWIRSVMVYTAISTYRSRCKTETVTALGDDDGLFCSHDDIYGSIDAEVIMQAVQQLPPSYRVAFNLYEIEGYSYPEVSEMLGISETTVRTNLFRARKLLAKKLAAFKNY